MITQKMVPYIQDFLMQVLQVHMQLGDTVGILSENRTIRQL